MDLVIALASTPSVTLISVQQQDCEEERHGGADGGAGGEDILTVRAILKVMSHLQNHRHRYLVRTMARG